MRAWRIYFWFCVLQLIMNYRAAMMSTVAWYDVINWASNTTNPPDISSNIGYVIILMLTIPQCLALYRYAVNWHHLPAKSKKP